MTLALEWVLRPAEMPLALRLLCQLCSAALILYRIREVLAECRQSVQFGAVVLFVGTGRPEFMIDRWLIVRFHGHMFLSEIGADEEAPI